MHEIHPHLRFISPQNFPDPKFNLISDSPHPDIAPIQNLDFKIYPHLKFISPQNSPNTIFTLTSNSSHPKSHPLTTLSSVLKTMISGQKSVGGFFHRSKFQRI